ncbi:ribosome-recycling factor, mitochondrial [Rhineura floridana]|uniref:ribosome-recycling factor, mitochondrial n=1 Tax=Rhineura floridana TaxID=261503 RepID=UPI002AC87B57|nr:ribosome-recycling factor, mitochondrial [Rhineura floridana]XP_061460033.1 ribosome-recycling factor, mitochondrial [Rhineura floridana]XP_061460034.1 ribosome-recycling factor, mitochondrial [Rhineura floridana]
MAGPLRCLRQLAPLLCYSALGTARPSLQAPLKLGGLLLPGCQGTWAHHQTAQARHLATKKAKAKGKGQARVNINASLVEDIISLDEVDKDMRSVVKALQEDFSKSLSIRTSPGALDHIIVTTKDGKFPLNQLGQISLKPPQLILVNMSSFPESAAAALKAIQESGMNLNPEADGPIIRVPVPMVTREHRENLVTVAKQLTNRAKESLRKVRAGAINQTKKAKSSVSEDTIKLIEKQIQQMVDDTAGEMDTLLAAKTKELLG